MKYKDLCITYYPPESIHHGRDARPTSTQNNLDSGCQPASIIDHQCCHSGQTNGVAMARETEITYGPKSLDSYLLIGVLLPLNVQPETENNADTFI